MTVTDLDGSHNSELWWQSPNRSPNLPISLVAEMVIECAGENLPRIYREFTSRASVGMSADAEAARKPPLGCVPSMFDSSKVKVLFTT